MCIIIILLLAIRMQVMYVYVLVLVSHFLFSFSLFIVSLFCLCVGRYSRFWFVVCLLSVNFTSYVAAIRHVLCCLFACLNIHCWDRDVKPCMIIIIIVSICTWTHRCWAELYRAQSLSFTLIKGIPNHVALYIYIKLKHLKRPIFLSACSSLFSGVIRKGRSQ